MFLPLLLFNSLQGKNFIQKESRIIFQCFLIEFLIKTTDILFQFVGLVIGSWIDLNSNLTFFCLKNY
ncbi:hypothetical protein HKBW3S03_01656, partial [Candidatus Hakubella thermalkaliphila]